MIEVALRHAEMPGLDVARIRPPYRSEWPSFKIPEADELMPWGKWDEGMSDEVWARVSLHHSVMKDEDFSRYVIGDLGDWSAQRLSEPLMPTHKQLHDQFVESLTCRQRDAWDAYCAIQRKVELYRRLEPADQEKFFRRHYSDAELESEVNEAERNLVQTIGRASKKCKLFREAVRAYVMDPIEYQREDNFDAELARRWMMQRIIDMGWTVERFGRFDRYVNRYSDRGRDANKAERIGKKYQWIAYHELLARLSDNFRMSQDRWSGERRIYEGTWSCSCH